MDASPIHGNLHRFALAEAAVLQQARLQRGLADPQIDDHPVAEQLGQLHEFLGDDVVSILPVYPWIVGRRRVARTGPWSAYLGRRAPVFCIERIIRIGEEFSVFSAFYADSERLRPLWTRPVAELGAANFKLVMARGLRLPITEIEHRARIEGFPRRVCRGVAVPPGTVGMVLQVTARSGVANYAYYQEIYIPPNRCTLEIRTK